jgi:hypothetical protein
MSGNIAAMRVIGGLIAGLACAALPVSALAQTVGNDQIKQLQDEIRQIQKQYQSQIRGLQKQLDDLKAAQAAPKAPPPPTYPPSAPGLTVPPPGGVLPPPVPGGPGAPPPEAPPSLPAAVAAAKHGIFGTGIDVSMANSFIEAASIFRTRNETADIASDFNTGIPIPNNPNYHLSEFRESVHQSRLSIVARGSVDEFTKLGANFETDFQSAGVSANSVESNSYGLRLRLAYATIDKNDWGTSFLGGQSWSFLTMFKQDMTPGQELIPLTIDAQYVPGFTWLRNPEARIVQYFGIVSAGLAAESPQAVIFNGPNAPLVPTTDTNPGGRNLNSTANYSTDVGPDLIAKVTLDPGWRHFEAYGLGRAFRSRANFSNRVVYGGGGGVGGLFPVIPKLLDFQADFLIGNGIGRYGAVGLPDVAVKSTGVLVPISELQALVGLVGHPTDYIDLYAYAGIEQASQTSFTVNGTLPFGYGNPLYNNTACLHEAASAAAAPTNCAANTSRVWQVTGGFWWDVYKGDFGRLRVGGQGSFTERQVFAGIGGGPNTNEGIFMASLRYYPFSP